MTPRCKSQIGADRRSRSKAGGVVDGVAECQRRHDADTRNRHETAAYLIRPCQLADLVIELSLLLTNLFVDRQ